MKPNVNGEQSDALYEHKARTERVTGSLAVSISIRKRLYQGYFA